MKNQQEETQNESIKSLNDRKVKEILIFLSKERDQKKRKEKMIKNHPLEKE